jgi:hypothetical protein
VVDKKQPAFSESDKGELDAIISDREREKVIAAFLSERSERRKRKVEAVRGWASLFITIAAAVTLLSDKLIALWKWLLALAG